MTPTTRILIAALMVTGFASSLSGQSANPPISPSAHPTIVLVHGAFADGSSWSKVIPILQRDGYTVIAVQNPLTSFAADVETTKRVAPCPDVDDGTGNRAYSYRPVRDGAGS